MKTLNELFEKYYSKDALHEDIKLTENKIKNLLFGIREKLYYDLDKPIEEYLKFVSYEIAKKSFCLGFSLATKLSTESFVGKEDYEKNTK